MPYSPEQEARRRQLEHDLHQANVEKSTVVVAERKEHSAAERAVVEKQVLSEMELIDRPSECPEKMIELLQRLSNCRNLTSAEMRCLKLCHAAMVWREHPLNFS
jgi:hypothetical protein